MLRSVSCPSICLQAVMHRVRALQEGQLLERGRCRVSAGCVIAGSKIVIDGSSPRPHAAACIGSRVHHI